MINQIIPIVFALYFAAEWNHYTYTIIWASVLTNFVFSVTVLKEACRSSTFQKIITGEVTAIMKYCLFLNLHQPKILLYYLPLLLSSSGKIYLLIEEKSKVQKQYVEELLNLQCKTEIFTFFYFILERIIMLLLGQKQYSLTFIKLIVFISYLKFKYTFDISMRESFKQVHFFMDKISRISGCRQFYHNFYSYFKLLGKGNLSKNRQIGYF